jgi:TIGR03987 family protein
MLNLLPFAIVFISLALVFYSIGVWGEKIAGRLQAWQLVFFWLGFACDTTGTTLMTKLAGSFELNLHGITGLLAIVLMIIHAVWATITLVRKNETALKNFHRFSLAVWFIWLIPYFIGMIQAMAK